MVTTKHSVEAEGLRSWLEDQALVYAFGYISGWRMQMLFLPACERWQILRDGKHVAYFHKDLYETAAAFYNNAGFDQVDND